MRTPRTQPFRLAKRFLALLLLALALAGNPRVHAEESTGALSAEELSERIRQLFEQYGAEMPGEPPAERPARSEDSQSLDLAALKRQYQNCVVKIEFTMIGNVEETKFNPTKSEDYYSGDEPPHGTGFFIGEGQILTNAHVVEEARQGSIRIKSPATGNVEFKADVVGVGGSETIDLAILRLPEDELVRFKKRSGLETIPSLTFGDSNGVKQADALAIFGYPESSNELKIIQAKVTGREYLRRSFDTFVCGHQFIEVGPAGVVQPGNSGGPALSPKGEVVGIPARGNWGGTQGWLIPSDVALRFLDQVRASERGLKEIEIPQLGIALTENFPGTAVWTGASEDLVVFELGVVVRDIIKGSLADKWGLKANDILVGFANDRLGISCAIDFKGYRVTTGKMRQWPPSDAQPDSEEPPARLHLKELILLSKPGDKIKIWYLRKGEALQILEKDMEYLPPVRLPYLGVFEKPDFELWGDFVAQDFNTYNASLFEVPAREVLNGGALVTYIEPNSLASRRGMALASRSPFGFAFSSGSDAGTSWVIIDSINEEPVKNLSELRTALRKAEQAFEAKAKEPGYEPARKALMKERYIQIGFRTNTSEGRVLRLTPGFPIDEALECRSVLEQKAQQNGAK